MSYDELTRNGQISYRYDLAATPTIQCLQRIFYDLYAHARLDPEYLFMTGHDQAMLRRQIIECTNVRFPPSQLLDALATNVCCLLNEITGKLVQVIILPRLESGSVIVGFFR